jgi:TIR domain
VEKPAGHAFISYVREDAHHVDHLQRNLQAAGVPVWRDTADLWPGQDWRRMIRRAITDNALVFIACFSSQSLAKKKSYQNEELALAVEQLRQRQPDDPWLIPVRFDDCEVPDLDIGAGRTLASIERADLFGDRYEQQMRRLVVFVQRLLGQHPPDQDAKDKPNPRPRLTPARSERQSARREEEDAAQPAAPATHVPAQDRGPRGYNYQDPARLSPGRTSNTGPQGPGSKRNPIDKPPEGEFAVLKSPGGPEVPLTQRKGVPHAGGSEVLARGEPEPRSPTYRSADEASSLINMRTMARYRDWVQLRDVAIENPSASVLLTWKLIYFLIYREAYKEKAAVTEDWATQLPLIASRLGASRRMAAVLEDLADRRRAVEEGEELSRSDALEYIDAADTALHEWLGRNADIDTQLRYGEG